MTPFREYCVVLPSERLPVGRWIQRSRWPAHVTVCANFRSGPDDVDVLAAVLRQIAEATSPIVATVAGDALFGPARDVPVHLVEFRGLHELHAIVEEAMGRVARFEPIEPAHHGVGYRPHVSIVDGERLEPGSAIRLSTLLLVEIGPDGDRTVAVPVGTVELGAAESPEPVRAERAASTWARLGAADIRSWVIGGWGIDALVGEQTREHHDLDLFVLEDDLDRLLGILQAPGAGIRHLWSENRWLDRRPSAFVADLDGVELDVHVVGLDGDAVLIRSAHTIELPVGALTATGTIAGTEIACATASAQRVMHSGYELPAKQLRDLEALGRVGA